MNDKPYKLASVDKAKIVAAAQKALIAADSQYFAWSSERQERYRATMKRDARTRVRRVLLNSLLNIQCSPDQVDDVWDDVPIEQLNLLNWASLLTTGIGEDSTFLNEAMAEDKSLLDFLTLYEYDYEDYLFQEEARRRDFLLYKGADYYAWRHPSWARLLIDGRFYYATLLSLATRFVDEIESAGNEQIDQLIPHKYLDGRDNGKPEQGGFLWDMKLDAQGQEGQLNELRSRWYTYQQGRWLDLSKTFSQLPPAVYTKDENWDNDPHRFFIFNNAEALKQIRWRHFLSDCRPFMTELATLDGQLTQEIERATSWLTDNHQDIIKNYDPTVVKLQKKKKIILSPGALDDLSRIGRDDESPR